MIPVASIISCLFDVSVIFVSQGLQRLVYDYDSKLLAVGAHMKDAATGNYTDTTILTDYNAVRESVHARNYWCSLFRLKVGQWHPFHADFKCYRTDLRRRTAYEHLTHVQIVADTRSNAGTEMQHNSIHSGNLQWTAFQIEERWANLCVCVCVCVFCVRAYNNMGSILPPRRQTLL